VQVVVVAHVRIEAFGTAEDFHDVDQPNFSQRRQGSVDGVEGDMGVVFLNVPKNGVRRRMPVRLHQGLIDGHALGRDFETMATAGRDETLKPVIARADLHASLK
jgi:hypothetical protein